jgi:hypothetical protein
MGNHLLDELTNILDSSPQQEPSTRHPNKLLSWMENTLRVLGLQFIHILCLDTCGLPKNEVKRTPFIKDPVAVMLASLLHLLPVSAAIVLIVLTGKGYYIGGELSGKVEEDGLRFLGLQIAAKLHELTMLASLTQIVFSTVRNQLLTGRAVPFAALTSGLQVSTVSYLWSR